MDGGNRLVGNPQGRMACQPQLRAQIISSTPPRDSTQIENGARASRGMIFWLEPNKDLPGPSTIDMRELEIPDSRK